MKCELCNVEEGCVEHHLIPKSLHKNKWFRKRFSLKEMKSRTIMVCEDCAKMVHALIPDEKELGRNCNVLETLIKHPDIQNYVAWKRRRVNS